MNDQVDKNKPYVLSKSEDQSNYSAPTGQPIDSSNQLTNSNDDFDYAHGINLDCEQALDKAGSFGRFQYFLCIVIILCMNSGGLVTYGITFLELDPTYTCQYKSDDFITNDCNIEDICTTDLIEWYQIDQESIYTLQNWVTMNDLTCMPSLYMGYVGSLTSAGAAISCLFLPIIGDIYGRWTLLQIVIVGQMPLYLINLIVHRMWAIYFLSFYMGVCLIGRFSAGFILLTELNVKRHQVADTLHNNLCGNIWDFFILKDFSQVVSRRSVSPHQVAVQTALCIGDCSAILFCCLFYRYISKNAMIMLWLGFAINCLAFILLWWIPESPLWLASQKRFKEAKDVFAYIAKFNKQTDYNLQSLKLENEARAELNVIMAVGQDANSKEKLPSTKVIDVEIEEADDLLKPVVGSQDEKTKSWAICSDKVLIWNLAMMSLQWVASSMDYYIMTYFLKYIPGNFYVNTTVNGFSSIVAYGTSAIVFKKFGGKISFMVSYAIAIVGGICIMSFEQFGGLWMAFFVLLASFGISFAFNIAYMQLPPLFPTKVTSTAFGICNLFARCMTVISPIIAEVDEPIPMLFFCVMAAIAAVTSIFLKTNVKYD